MLLLQQKYDVKHFMASSCLGGIVYKQTLNEGTLFLRVSYLPCYNYLDNFHRSDYMSGSRFEKTKCLVVGKLFVRKH